jgi:hypothetical protein
MEQKRAVTGKQAANYRAQKGRRGRTRVLDTVVGVTGYKRHYAAWLLRNFGRQWLVRGLDGKAVRLVVGRRNKRRVVARPRTYDERVERVLVFVWECFDYMCGKRLAAILPRLLPLLVRHRRLKKSEPTYQKLLRISAATIDRLLAKERASRRLKGISHTKPSSQLKSSIPIVISSELPRDQPGCYQIDLVGHDGGNPNGQFAFSLTAIELYSGWVEPRILLNKAQRWSKEALISVKEASPVPLKCLHSDNDSAFLNEQLQRWARGAGICYARARPYHNNDTCYVEQKNYNIVRQAVGYLRYDSEEEVALIHLLYRQLRLLVNFFYPSVKLLEKKRIQGRISKRYDSPRTPADRLLEADCVTAAIKQQLSSQRDSLDPLVLKRDIERIQTQLLALGKRKGLKPLYPGPAYPGARDRMWEHLFGPTPPQRGVSRHGEAEENAL